MTVTVRMIIDVHPKSRMDGRSWPPPGEAIELGEAEAADVMAAGWAVPDDGEDAVDRGYNVLKAADPDWDRPGDEGEEGNDDFEDEDAEDPWPEEEDDDFDREYPAEEEPAEEDTAEEDTEEEPAEEAPDEVDDDFDRDPVEGESEEQVKKPYANAPKAEWRNWALANGADEGEIENYTKADLIARYGNL